MLAPSHTWPATCVVMVCWTESPRRTATVDRAWKRKVRSHPRQKASYRAGDRPQDLISTGRTGMGVVTLILEVRHWEGSLALGGLGRRLFVGQAQAAGGIFPAKSALLRQQPEFPASKCSHLALGHSFLPKMEVRCLERPVMAAARSSSSG
jgi:hypothetical protein